MINPVYFTHFSSLNFPPKKMSVPRKRYIKYYADLYSLYDIPMSEKALIAGGQYSYAQLGDGILEKLSDQDLLRDIDLMVIVTWSPEFDAEYASCSAYFNEKYRMQCRLIDVGDQGTLAPFSALKIIHACLAGERYSNALLLVLEQTTIPRQIYADKRLPKWNAAIGLIISKQTSYASVFAHYELLDSGVINQGSDFSITKFVATKCEKYNLEAQAVDIYLANLEPIDADERVIRCFHDPGIIPLFMLLGEILAKQKRKIILYFGQDIESGEIGYLVLRRYL